eukprot:m.53746 g.53746  ORF g.53746 m.53746 type:complete len:326 (-) comp13193_c0_seq1:412-1389(-)
MLEMSASLTAITAIAAVVVAAAVAGFVLRLLGRSGSNKKTAPARKKASAVTIDGDDDDTSDVQKFEGVLLRDKSILPCRFSVGMRTFFCGYDPASPKRTILQAFKPIQEQSNCIFAKHARIWAAHDYDPSLPIADNLASSLRAFALFAAAQRGIDGFLFAVAHPGAGATLASHAYNINQILRFLSDRDPHGYRCMDKSFIDKRGWVFSFAGEEFFITTFASCYNGTHARYSYGVEDHTFLLLQPYHSFLWHDIPNDTPHTNWDTPQTSRDRIRLKFRDAGMPYVIPADPNAHPVATSIVPPLEYGGPVVRWWECDSPTAMEIKQS